MKFREFLKRNIVLLDGGMGTLLAERGLGAERPETWNVTRANDVIAVHKAYFDAGSNVVLTNTFGANSLHFGDDELKTVIFAAVKNAKLAAKSSSAPQEKFVALDVGPTGKLLAPLGELDFEKAVEIFAKTVRLGVEAGADLVMIETMSDCYETKAALLAAKEVCDLPVLVSNAYNKDGILLTGASPECNVAIFEGLGADAVGANCSFGPQALLPVVERLLSSSSVPVLFKPNAGIPSVKNGKTVFDVSPEEFAGSVFSAVKLGVRIVGGCCGTTPEHISLLHQKIKDFKPVEIIPKTETVISSYSNAVVFGEKPVVIGERINPTGKKRFKQAIIENDIPYILNVGLEEEKSGADVLDVNVGIPDADESKTLVEVVKELQAVTPLPLQIDTSNATAMEIALRRYNGKALVNSVNGTEQSMNAVFPLVKKYGGVVVALTLDESGIPQTVEGRFEIAKKILTRAEKFGILKKDVIFDTLAMTVSADNEAALVTLQTLAKIRNELGCHTVLGISNVSFGLPAREIVNGAFLSLALSNGLSAAIVNPDSAEIVKALRTYALLTGKDENCAEYISAATRFSQTVQTGTPTEKARVKTLGDAIRSGLKEEAAKLTAELIKTQAPLDVVNGQIIPALDEVGKAFKNKTVYLPQLLTSAEAAKRAFEVVKTAISSSGKSSVKKSVFVLATVQGDIHDIGKNIVRLLLENYGFEVVDLGRDVPPQKIADEVVGRHAPLCGLSALMTTTVPAMEQTVALLKKVAPWCKTVVGGAVLNEEYAKKIGADKYARDAMETVRYAESVFDSEK